MNFVKCLPLFITCVLSTNEVRARELEAVSFAESSSAWFLPVREVADQLHWRIRFNEARSVHSAKQYRHDAGCISPAGGWHRTGGSGFGAAGRSRHCAPHRFSLHHRALRFPQLYSHHSGQTRGGQSGRSGIAGVAGCPACPADPNQSGPQWQHTRR